MNRVAPVVLLAVALGGCAPSGADESAGPSLSSVPISTAEVGDPGLTAAGEALAPLLESRFRGTFAGLVVSPSEGAVVVYRLPDEALDDAARAAAPEVRLRFVDAAYPLSRLEEVVERINADVDYWKSRGVRLTTWGPAPDGSGVTVSTVAGDADREALLARYGDVIRVSQEDFPVPVPKSIPPTPTR